MNPALEKLLVIQDFDTRLARVESALAALPARQAKAQARLSNATAALEVHRESLRKLELARRDGEREVDALSAQERKFQGQTMQVKTNEELWALQKEIEGVRGRRSELETAVLERMEEEGSRRQELPFLERAVAEAKLQLEVETRSIEEERARLAVERNEQVEARDRVLAELPAELSARYARVLRSRGSPAVVRLLRNACGGCMSAQPPQRVQEVRAGDLVVVCEFCGRLIVGTDGDARG